MPHPQIKIVGESPDGNIRAIAVNEDGSLPVSGAVGGGSGGGDASAANQEIANNFLQQIKNVVSSSTLVVIPPNNLMGDASGIIAVSNTSQLALNENSARSYLFLQNLSPVDPLWFNFGSEASDNQPSIKLLPEQSFTMEGTIIARDSIHVFGSSGTNYTLKFMIYLLPHH